MSEKTDLQRFIDTYASVGIVLKPEQGTGHEAGTQFLVLSSGDDRVDGYMGFYTEICFDKDGGFVEQRILE